VSKITLNVGDWFTVNSPPDQWNGRYYEIIEIEIAKGIFKLQQYSPEGMITTLTFTEDTIIDMINNNTWYRDGNVQKQQPIKHKCKYCGMEEDHRGMQYYFMEGKCRIW
jgi:hypothetical protein